MDGSPAVTLPAPLPDASLRRAFSADDVRRMVEAGILDEDERVELVEGELVGMAAKSFAHDRIKNALLASLVRATGPDVVVAVESTLRVSSMTLLEPDILVCPKRARTVSPEGYAVVAGPDVLLAVEVAASSLAYDRGRKARLYARHGMPEYWVIDVAARTALVHTGPNGEAWDRVEEHGPETLLRPLAPALHALAVRLADLD